MPKRALLIGVDKYKDFPPLEGCCDDAKKLAELLGRNSDRTANFDCHVPGSDIGGVTAAELSLAVQDAFKPFDGDILFYFSGHGSTTVEGSFLVTKDGKLGALGYDMKNLLTVALNALKAGCQSVTIILDCCHAGSVGNAPGHNDLIPTADLPEGITLLAASRPREDAMLINGRSVFTNLVMQALDGGAADIRGKVSAASVYAYVENAFNAFEQRPIYKSHSYRLPILRQCAPSVRDDQLLRITEIFENRDAEFPLDETYETHRLKDPDQAKRDENDDVERQDRTPEKKEIRDLLKYYQFAGLLKPKHRNDIFWACLYREPARLTPLGKYYWHLVDKGRI